MADSDESTFTAGNAAVRIYASRKQVGSAAATKAAVLIGNAIAKCHRAACGFGLLAIFACAGIALQAAPVTLKHGDKKIEVVIGGHPFTTYYFSDVVAKPYLMPLRTASGIVISRGFPIVNKVTPADEKTRSFEPHQRPLYFGHGDIDGLNFWAEKAFNPYYHGYNHEAYGSMSLLKLEEAAGGADSGTIRASFNLLAPSGRVIAEETQTFTFRGDNQARIVDCEFVVHANHGPVTFGDTKEGTFAVRLGPALSAPHDHMSNSKGAQGEAAIWGKPADWVSYSGTVSGKTVNVTVFDNPNSFRHPTTWHARAYGLLAANPFGWREFTKDPAKDGSWTVPEGKSLTFRYRVLIYEGHLSPDQLAGMYRQYSHIQ
jgi:hypothetical protein